MVLIKAELEYRLWIPGKPKSLQSESKQAYRAAIQAAARQQFTTPLASKVELQVIFADKHSTRPDADIVLKPILDALTGVAFVDDKQVTKLGSYVLPMDESLRIAAGEPHHTCGCKTTPSF
jgi:Holliday junction resolvase RusA-like endonuclease